MRIESSRGAALCAGVLGLCVPMGARAQWSPPNPVVSFEKNGQALEVRQRDGVLRMEVCAPDVLHVTYAPLNSPAVGKALDKVVIKEHWPATEFGVSSDEKSVTLTTAKLKVEIEHETGAIHYANADGKPLTTDTYRTLHPAEVN